MQRSLQRSLAVALAIYLLCLAAPGCMHLPFFIPEFNYAPSMDAKCSSEKVHVFRVDVTQTMEIKEARSGGLRGDTVDREELSRIYATSQGSTFPQVGMTGSYGWRYVGVWNYCSSKTGHAIGLRFYRPGYETIVLKPGETPRELEWKEATDLIAQAIAVDDLMGVGSGKSAGAATFRHVLEPGTRSSAHREALLFGASEYDRLAHHALASDAEDRELNTRLLEKAARLRALADAKQPSEP